MAKDGKPTTPIGTSEFWFFMRKTWDALWGGKLPIKGKDGCVIEWDSGSNTYYISSAKKSAPGSAGWFWKSGARVFDETLSYEKDQIVYIPSSHGLVTTGIDNGGTPVYAIAGLWIATQNTDGTTATLPTWPYPVADDPDNAANYWWLISAAQVCD